MDEKNDRQKTHLSVCADLVGRVENIVGGRCSRVTLAPGEVMRVDETGLIHGGFTFGLADYAAMVAVNDPYVVLVAANVFFRKPVVCGDVVTARARVTEAEGAKRKVFCEITNQEDEKVFEGEFSCRVLEKPVLSI